MNRMELKFVRFDENRNIASWEIRSFEFEHIPEDAAKEFVYAISQMGDSLSALRRLRRAIGEGRIAGYLPRRESECGCFYSFIENSENVMDSDFVEEMRREFPYMLNGKRTLLSALETLVLPLCMQTARSNLENIPEIFSAVTYEEDDTEFFNIYGPEKQEGILTEFGVLFESLEEFYQRFPGLPPLSKPYVIRPEHHAELGYYGFRELLAALDFYETKFGREETYNAAERILQAMREDSLHGRFSSLASIRLFAEKTCGCLYAWMIPIYSPELKKEPSSQQNIFPNVNSFTGAFVPGMSGKTVECSPLENAIMYVSPFRDNDYESLFGDIRQAIQEWKQQNPLD